MVVVGLIIGGIISGKYLVHSSEKNSIIRTLGKYESAVLTFRDQYESLPGDMPNAIDVWGAAHATPATCQTTQGTGTQTCNGDGDGMIEWGSEMFRAWQQLQIAGLVDGSFTGIAGSAGTKDGIPGQNLPIAAMKGGAYSLIYWTDTLAGSTSWFTDMENVIWVGKDKTDSNTYSFWELFTAVDAQDIDSKIDDGRPGTGRVRATPDVVPGGGVQDYTPTCSDSTTATAALYAINTPGNICSLAYKIGK